MSSYFSEVERKSDGVCSACIMLDDYYGNHRYGVAIPDKKHYPLRKEDIASLQIPDCCDIYPIEGRGKMRKYRIVQK